MAKLPSIGFGAPQRATVRAEREQRRMPLPPPRSALFAPSAVGRSPADLEPSSSFTPAPAAGHLYPTIGGPPGTVAVHSPESHFITLRESLENAPLPPIAQQQQWTATQCQPQFLPFAPPPPPPPYYDQFGHSAAAVVGGDLGVRYLVRESPHMQAVPAVHAFPNGNAAAVAGGETMFYYISSTSPATDNFQQPRRELPNILWPPRRPPNNKAGIVLFAVIASIIMLFFFVMHSKISHEFNQQQQKFHNPYSYSTTSSSRTLPLL